MDNELLMNNQKRNFEESIDSLKFVLQICGFELKAIRIEPKLSQKGKELLKERGIDAL